jgi:hypothetical protein
VRALFSPACADRIGAFHHPDITSSQSRARSSSRSPQLHWSVPRGCRHAGLLWHHVRRAAWPCSAITCHDGALSPDLFRPIRSAQPRWRQENNTAQQPCALVYEPDSQRGKRTSSWAPFPARAIQTTGHIALTARRIQHHHKMLTLATRCNAIRPTYAFVMTPSPQKSRRLPPLVRALRLL